MLKQVQHDGKWRPWPLLALGLPLITLAVLWFLTLPPALPSYDQVRAAYRPSESWLYDRNGHLLDSERVDFAVRRLGWAPLSAVAPSLPKTLIAAEDKRFATHRGVDWIATFGALRD